MKFHGEIMKEAQGVMTVDTTRAGHMVVTRVAHTAVMRNGYMVMMPKEGHKVMKGGHIVMKVDLTVVMIKIERI